MANEKVGKLREPEARILALQIAATFPSHYASMAQIKKKVPSFRELSEADLKPSPSRPNECMWQQIIGNVVCHKGTGVSIFNRGWADRIESRKSIRVTETGLAHLKGLGLYE